MATAEEQFHQAVRARIGKDAAPATIHVGTSPGGPDADAIEARYRAKVATRALGAPAPEPAAKTEPEAQAAGRKTGRHG